MSNQIKHCIAVASGKGGVGKSTVAANLALALAQTGAKVGLLDADIYGPSLPTLFALKDKQPAIDPVLKKILPLVKFDIKLMSIGFMMREQDAVIWRGPMVHKMLAQFVSDVNWGELDYLILDLPPGTGDIQISLSQLLSLSGAVIVTTPQDIALADVVRGVAMFEKVGIKVLGVIENMSGFECPHCHKNSEIFSRGGGEKKAMEMKVNFLGALPLDLDTREASDLGHPLVAQIPGHAQSKRFKEIAQSLIEQIEKNANEKIEIQNM